MDASNIAMYVAKASGKSKREIAEQAGRKSNGFDPYYYGNRIPTLPTMARLCDICNFDLLVRDRFTGDETIIDPPVS